MLLLDHVHLHLVPHLLVLRLLVLRLFCLLVLRPPPCVLSHLSIHGHEGVLTGQADGPHLVPDVAGLGLADSGDGLGGLLVAKDNDEVDRGD